MKSQTKLTPPVLHVSPGQISKMCIEHDWLDLLRRATSTKDAIDFATRWHGVDALGKEDGNKAWIDCVLSKHGLCLQDFADSDEHRGPVNPDHFFRVLLGSLLTGNSGPTQIGLTEIDSRAILGWVRKEAYRETPLRNFSDVRACAEIVRSSAGNESFYGMKCMPLYWTGEGKNRTHLFRLAKLPLTAQLHLFPAPDLKKFEARPIFGLPWAVALYHPCGIDVLPLGKLSSELLKAIGVPWSDKPSLRAWFHVKRCIEDREGKSSWSWFKFLRWSLIDRALQVALLGHTPRKSKRSCAID